MHLKVLLLTVGLLAYGCIAKSSDNEDSAGHHGEDEGWSYHGKYDAENWYQVNPLCSINSPRQSPIDIELEATVFGEELEAIHLNEKIDGSFTEMKIVNNGHSVNIEVPHAAFISGGALPKNSLYRVAGIHFHWGSEDSLGSEHTVQGKAFPLEMHMVSYDTLHHDELGSAVFGDNSLAVLGTIFQISEKNNSVFDSFINGLKKVQQSGSSATIEHFNIGRLLPAHTNKYFRYMGSLTTPPCAESVVWTLFLYTQTISSAQMKELRNLLESPHGEGEARHIEDNFRPTQALYGRTVHRSFLLKSELPPTEANAAVTVAPTISFVLLCYFIKLFI